MKNRYIQEKETDEELARIRPCRSVEPLDGDSPTALKQHSLVHHVGRLLPVLRYYVLRRERRSGRPELLQIELAEAGHRLLLLPTILCTKNSIITRERDRELKEEEEEEGTHVSGLQDGGFEVGRPPADAVLGAAASHCPPVQAATKQPSSQEGS